MLINLYKFQIENNNKDDDNLNLRNPVATVLVTEAIQDSTAPVAASFSSRGPHLISPDILKVKQRLLKWDFASFFSKTS